MGRSSGWGRETTDGEKKIELSYLRKRGWLKPERVLNANIGWNYNGSPSGNIDITIFTLSDNPRIIFDYKSRDRGTEEWTPIKFSFPLESIPCRYGGRKWYFRCQLYKNGICCNKRVRILYQVGKYYGCRHCADLSYNSCNESKRFKTGMWRILSQEWKAEDYYNEKVKRRFYRGKLTKKYMRFLAIQDSFSMRDVLELERQTREMDRVLKKR